MACQARDERPVGDVERALGALLGEATGAQTVEDMLAMAGPQMLLHRDTWMAVMCTYAPVTMHELQASKCAFL